ncbi:MAG: hypothetical protein RLZZ609_2454 [Cyanobacteriota bacterium]|jgi:hypothetical protein
MVTPFSFTPCMERFRAAFCMYALGSWLLAMALSSPSVQAQAIQSPAPGVLCDAMGLRGSGVCYDNQGVSLALTGRYLGRRAEAQLRTSLATNPAPVEFRLSNGTVCSVPARTCWEDGWSKRNVAQRLSSQLFGQPGPAEAGSAGDGWISGQPSRDTGLCSLSRGSRPVFDGRCDLRQVKRGDGLTRYQVRLANGTSYVFSQRNGTVSIADDFGSTWPVTYVNHGVTGIFRWAEMTLVATQTADRGSAALPATSSNDDLGRAIGTLLNTLFR